MMSQIESRATYRAIMYQRPKSVVVGICCFIALCVLLNAYLFWIAPNNSAAAAYLFVFMIVQLLLARGLFMGGDVSLFFVYVLPAVYAILHIGALVIWILSGVGSMSSQSVLLTLCGLVWFVISKQTLMNSTSGIWFANCYLARIPLLPAY